MASENGDRRKYELLEDDYILVGLRKLYRIRALRDFRDVKFGDLGGYIECEDNLSHKGSCWVYQEAKVYDHAAIVDSAQIRGFAKIRGYALVKNRASVYGLSEVYGNAVIGDTVEVCGKVTIGGRSHITGDIRITGRGCII